MDPRDLDVLVAGLHDRAVGWAQRPVPARRALLEELVADVLAAAPGLVAAAAAHERLALTTAPAAEGWAVVVLPLVRQLRRLARTLADVEAGRPATWTLRTRDDGRVVAGLVPDGAGDRLRFPGVTAEAVLAPGATLAEVTGGRPVHEPAPGVEVQQAAPGVTLVLGGDTLGACGLLDVLAELLVRGHAVLLAVSPALAHVAPALDTMLRSLVRDGLLRVCLGGQQVARHLVDHAGIDVVHRAGADDAHDAVPGAAGPAPHPAGAPIVVVPGPWRTADLVRHGHDVASALVSEAGASPVGARVLVQHRAWAKRRELLDAVRASLRTAVPRPPRPGARERWQVLADAYRSAERFGDLDADGVPFALVPQLDPDQDADLALAADPRCPVLAEVELDAPRTIPEYLSAAVALCNERLAGGVAATLLVHPRSLADPEIGAAVARAIDRLERPTVVLNHAAPAALGVVAAPWRVAPGVPRAPWPWRDLATVVVRGPFGGRVTPWWHHAHRDAATLLPRLARHAATDDASLVAGILWHRARG